MAELFEFLNTAETPKLFIVFGLLFLGVAIVGSITGRIPPGPIGRILGGVLGPVLIVGGLVLDGGQMPLSVAQAALPVAPVVATRTAVPTAVRFTGTPVATSSTTSGGKGTPVPTATPPRRTPVPTATPRSSLNTKVLDPKAIDPINR
jgi:hypothetical protein